MNRIVYTIWLLYHNYNFFYKCYITAAKGDITPIEGLYYSYITPEKVGLYEIVKYVLGVILHPIRGDITVIQK